MNEVFLIVSLIFPRITLFGYWMTTGVPSNTVPFWLDVVLATIIPRVLVCIYIYQNLGPNSPWFIGHVILTVLVYIFGVGQTRD